MKYYITGHLGFIGQHLTKRLDELGIEWEGYDLKAGQDIRDKAQLQEFLGEGITIHLAALAGVREGERRPAEYLNTNVVGTQNVLDCVQGPLIHFSSSSVLGNQLYGSVETDPFNPIGVYAISKMTSEYLVKHSQKPATIIRPFTVYGENGRPEQVIYSWINSIKAGEPVKFFGDGTTKRGYTYVGDLVEGILKLKDKPEKCEVYHLGGNEVITLEELFNIYQEVVPIEREMLELPRGDVPKNWAVIDKANRDFGYTAPTPFKEKVQEIIKYETSKL